MRMTHETRRLLHDGALIRVEWLHVAGLTRERTQIVHSPEFQLLLPLEGVFNWHLGSSTTLVNANHVVFISPGDVSQDSHPASGDVGCLLLTPRPDLIERIGQRALRAITAERVAPMHARTQRAAAMLLAAGGPANDDGVEETAIHLLHGVASVKPDKRVARNGSHRLVEAVKEMLATHDGRLSLAEIAAQLDVSPAHLTDTFRRSEGMPIAKYHRRLRLARALVELPHAADITTLALAFGFSSHAHFSAAFKETYREAPSEFRRAARSRALDRLRIEKI